MVTFRINDTKIKKNFFQILFGQNWKIILLLKNVCFNITLNYAGGVGKLGLYDRPGTVKSLAAPSKLKPSLHRIGLDRYLLHVTEAGTRVSPV